MFVQPPIRLLILGPW